MLHVGDACYGSQHHAINIVTHHSLHLVEEFLHKRKEEEEK